MQNGMIVLQQYGVFCLLEIRCDANGNPAGVAYYRPAEPTVVYTAVPEEDVTMVLEVFTFEGQLFAFMYAAETNYDGSTDMYEVTGDIYIEEGILFAMILDGFYQINDDNTLTYLDD